MLGVVSARLTTGRRLSAYVCEVNEQGLLRHRVALYNDDNPLA